MIHINKLGHNYEENININVHFGLFCSEGALAKHLNVTMSVLCICIVSD